MIKNRIYRISLSLMGLLISTASQAATNLQYSWMHSLYQVIDSKTLPITYVCIEIVLMLAVVLMMFLELYSNSIEFLQTLFTISMIFTLVMLFSVSCSFMLVLIA